MKINFVNQTNLLLADYYETIEKVLKNEVGKMSVIFVSDEAIKELNKTYRGKDKVTDVLSFPDNTNDYFGDCFIAPLQAFRQALEYGHSNLREMAFLAVHGYLHLTGYDHETKKEEEKMIARQELMLKEAKIIR
ncbi:MAG: rRNA maturation RNase YbeY [Erysipelotrichales bacterium]|nr:rRNA maturation RNase YbeY [Erysipelotrichales bacterium]